MSSNDITTLNSLIATTIDSANGYEEAAKNTHSADLGSQFAEFARDRLAVVTMLQDEVRRLGGTPELKGTVKAAAHRRWLDLKNAVAGSDAAVLQEVENGESYIRTKYEAALGDGKLSTDSRDVVSRAFDSVLAGHDRARALNHSYGGTASRQGGVWRTVGIAAALGGAAFAATRLMRSRRQTLTATPRQTRAYRTVPAPTSSTAAATMPGASTVVPVTSTSRSLDNDMTTGSAKRSGGRRSGSSDATRLAASGSDENGASGFGTSGEPTGGFGSTGGGTSFGAIGSDDLGRK